jgi:hypothetical protein
VAGSVAASRQSAAHFECDKTAAMKIFGGGDSRDGSFAPIKLELFREAAFCRIRGFGKEKGRPLLAARE